jgi:histidinol dehydrogenase
MSLGLPAPPRQPRRRLRRGADAPARLRRGRRREVEASVAAILADVRARGDAAVLEYTKRFDGDRRRSLAELEVPAGDLRAALAGLPAAQRSALEAAAARIRAFHERQREVAGRAGAIATPTAACSARR